MPWTKHKLGELYEIPEPQCSEAYARAVLQILHKGGIINEMPTPMDEVSPRAVLRLLQEIMEKICVVVGLADIHFLPASCFAPNAHLPSSLRRAGGRKPCPYEDDRGKCPVCICDPGPRVHGLHTESSAILWDESYPPTVAIHNGERIESSGEEYAKLQRNCPNPTDFACEPEHNEGSGDPSGEDERGELD